MNLYNFAYQTLFADANHVEHVRVTHAFCNDQRTGYFFNYAFAHLLPPRYERLVTVFWPLACDTYHLHLTGFFQLCEAAARLVVENYI